MHKVWLVLAIVGCSKPQKLWMDVHATQLHVGSLEADIPAGWRDYNELTTKPAIAMPEGARMILLEKNPNLGRVMVVPLPGAIQGDMCADAAKVWQAQLGDKMNVSDAEGASFNGNKGCMMRLSGPDGSGKIMVVTPQGGSSASVMCFGYAPELNEACYKMAYGLRATSAK